ncbi:hypothetical protein [Actinosynnema sp. NPDC023587]|uniref:hypothetical protein n=1 Tax=Actinosynnema sp. NPDC023587 TaxID=3154695 RepID=UPI0033E59198
MVTDGFILVGGRIVGTWTAMEGTVAVTPLRPFTRSEHVAVAKQGRELAALISDYAITAKRR